VSGSTGTYGKAAGDVGKTLLLWSLEEGKEVRQFDGHQKGVNAIAVSPNAKLLASGGMEDSSLKLWNVSDGTLLRDLKGHRDRITALEFFPDGSYLVSASKDGTLRVWDPDSGKNVQTLDLGVQGDYPRAVAISADSKVMALGTGFGVIKRYAVKGRTGS